MIPLYFLINFSLKALGQFTAARAALTEEHRLIFVMIMYAAMGLRGGVWILILKKMPLSGAHALTSLSYIIIPLLAIPLMGEIPSPERAAGALFILGGIILFYSGRAEEI